MGIIMVFFKKKLIFIFVYLTSDRIILLNFWTTIGQVLRLNSQGTHDVVIVCFKFMGTSRIDFDLTLDKCLQYQTICCLGLKSYYLDMVCKFLKGL